jgi:photosystem II stability/assembly factor-like uncharacterized protein
MNRLLLFCFVLVTLCSCENSFDANRESNPQNCDDMAGTSIDAPDEFEITLVSDLDFEMGYNQIHFIDNNKGFLLGGKNAGGTVQLIQTSDAGLTWEKANIETKPRQYPRSMNFKNDSTGFITISDVMGCPEECQNRSVLYKTTDGGKSWVELEYPDLNGYIHKLKIDSDGNLYGNLFHHSMDNRKMELLKSEDSGTTWKNIYTSESNNYLYSFALVNDTIYYFTDDAEIITVSIDGRELNRIHTNLSYIHGLKVLNENIHFISNQDGLFRTTDAGQSYQKITAERHKIIDFLSSDEGLIIKNSFTCNTDFPLTDDVFSYTQDGGKSWSESDESLNLMTSYNMNFKMPDHTYLAVIRNKLYRISKKQD